MLVSSFRILSLVPAEMDHYQPCQRLNGATFPSELQISSPMHNHQTSDLTDSATSDLQKIWRKSWNQTDGNSFETDGCGKNKTLSSGTHCVEQLGLWDHLAPQHLYDMERSHHFSMKFMPKSQWKMNSISIIVVCSSKIYRPVHMKSTLGLCGLDD